MKALVIGATGFVGPYLAQAIKDILFCEVVITKLSNDITRISGVREVFLNILNQEQIESILSIEQPDFIFHLASQSSVALSWKDPKNTVDVNVIGALNLLNSIRKLNYNPKVLIVGSGEEYGYVKESDVPIKENTSLNPGNVYAVTKVCQNMMATIYARAYGLHLVMTRSFNHIGPGQSPQFVVADFCNQVVNIERGLQPPVIRVGNLLAKRDFTDVRDVVKAYCRLILYGKSGETYNVGSGHAIAVQDILDIILSQSTAEIKVEIDPQKLRPLDIPIIEANISKIFRDTGWRKEIPLERTISETLNYWRERC